MTISKPLAGAKQNNYEDVKSGSNIRKERIGNVLHTSDKSGNGKLELTNGSSGVFLTYSIMEPISSDMGNHPTLHVFGYSLTERPPLEELEPLIMTMQLI